MELSITKVPIGILKLINWKFINKLFVNRINRLRSPIKIAVYGESGAGKTEFINKITKTGKHAKNITRNIERGNFLTLPNGRRIEFIDTPGQPSYRSSRNDLMEDFVNRKLTGIIHLVSYGYLSKPEYKAEHAFEPNLSRVKPSFLQDNRKFELDGMDEWMDIIRGSNKVKWMLTIVNKADLWYDAEDEVRAYYESGDYFSKVTSLNGHCMTSLKYYSSTFKAFLGHPIPSAISSEQQEQLHHELMEELYFLIFDDKG